MYQFQYPFRDFDGNERPYVPIQKLVPQNLNGHQIFLSTDLETDADYKRLWTYLLQE